MSQTPNEPSAGKTMLKRIELYRDRWTSYGGRSGIEALSDNLSPTDLRQYEIFVDFDDKFLERLSPDISLAFWKGNSVLFEQGAYLDLAFFIVDGTVEIYLEGIGGSVTTGPIFDDSRTLMVPLDTLMASRSLKVP